MRRALTPAAGGSSAALLATALLLLGATAAAAQEETVIVAFGDSITEGIGDDADRAEKGYPPRLQALLQGAGTNARVINRGVEGDTTAEGLSRINAVLNANRADLLLLMEGTNDIPNVSNETIVFNLDEIARRAAARGTQTIHATILPRRTNAIVDGNNRITYDLNVRIRELAWARDRKLADPWEVFWHTPGVFNRYYPAGDRFHPNAEGYDLLAEIFFDAVTGRDRQAPVLGRVQPTDLSEGIPANTNIRVVAYDFGAGINLSRTNLRINGQDVQGEVRGDNERVEIAYNPSTPLRGVVTVELAGEDLATPPNTVVRRATRFIVAGTRLLAGDVDRDGRVDGNDLVRLARAFGSRVGDPRYSNVVDLNSDGAVDGSDLAILAADFGRTAT